MFSEPQTVTVNAVPYTLKRISFSPSGVFQKDDGAFKLTIAHTLIGGRNRRVVRLDNYKVATDPLVPATNAPYRFGAWLVVDAPKVGYTLVEQKDIVAGLLAKMSETSYANVTALLGGEA